MVVVAVVVDVVIRVVDEVVVFKEKSHQNPNNVLDNSVGNLLIIILWW